ncbi:MAG: AzlD domain-containing protein [Motiliproteus sp.]|nr:AzlD domain-containing protein [Motiliproteus sp.]
MDNALWLALLVTAAGTFLMRLFPLLWMKRHLERHDDKDALEAIPNWLGILAPLMVAAMLGVSLVPKTIDLSAWIATAIGVVATVLAWRKTQSLGLPVFAGVAIYGLASLALSL